MNSILPSGLPRYNSANLTDNIKFDNQSVIIGENAGKDVKQQAALSKNYFNTFLGYSAGQNSAKASDTIFVGAQSGMNLYSGSNNIIIGRERDDGTFISVYDILSLGLFNQTLNNSISVGSYNQTNGYMSLGIGKYNVATGDANVTIGNNAVYNGSYNINIGNNNTGPTAPQDPYQNIDPVLLTTNKSIAIGNNIEMRNQAIMIGNNLTGTDTTVMNIGNVIIQDNQGLFLSQSNITPVCIGFQRGQTDQSQSQDGGQTTLQLLPTTSNAYSLYTNGGLYVQDRIAIGNFILSANSNITSEIEYILPDLPTNLQDANNVALSLNNKNELIWKRIYQNTDELPQGTTNLYYNNAQVDARVDAKFYEVFNSYFDDRLIQMAPVISLDQLKNGTSNKMIVNNVYQGDISVTGRLNVNHLIVNKIEVLGYGTNVGSALSSGLSDLNTVILNTSNALIAAINSLAARVAILESRVP
jgi:hypothetical protein